MRDYLDNFDTRVTTKSAEVTTSLDQQFVRFRDALDGRTQTLNEALGSRVMDIAKTMAEGGKEVVGALDKRIADVTAVINVRGAKLAESIGAKIDDIDKALGVRAMEVADNLDTRIGRFEELLVGRAETVTKEIETRSQDRRRAAQRARRAAEPARSGPAPREAAQAIEQLTTGQRRADQHAASSRSTSAIKTAHRREPSARSAIWRRSSATVISARLAAARPGDQDQHRRGRALAHGSSPPTPRRAIRSSAHDAERTLSGMSTGVSNVLKQNASEVERTLLARQRRGRAQLRRQGRRDHRPR